MKSFIHKIKFLALLSLLVVGGLVFSTSTSAEEEAKYWLAITPTRSAFDEMVPGKSYEGSFEVINKGTETATFEVIISPYSIVDETYTPDFEKPTEYTDITDWITTSIDGDTIKNGERAKIDFTINVPKDAHGGTQLASIIVRMTNEKEKGESTGVEMIQELAYLVYGNVDGDIIKTGKVLENKVPSFLFNPPILGTSIVENTGNVYTRAQYILQVFPLFGNEEVYTNEENPEGSIIFPETKRYNEIKWEGAPRLGIFRVRQTVRIFDDETITEKLVFLCPLWFLFIVLLLIFLIIFWIASRIFKRRQEA